MIDRTITIVTPGVCLYANYKLLISMTNQENQKTNRKWTRRLIPGAAATIFLGATGSALWDMVAKPGLGVVGRWILNAATLGSSRIRDAAYSSAALDPTSLAPLVIVLAIATVLPALLFSIITLEFGPSFIKRLPIASKILSVDSDQSALPAGQGRMNRLKRKLAYFIILTGTPLCIATYLMFSVLNQSILIHRIFNANLNILSPYLTDLDQKRFRSRFTLVTSKNDYQIIDNELDSIAKKNGQKLLPYEPW